MSQYVQGAGDVNQNYEKLLGLPNNFGQSGFPNIGANLIMPYGGSQYNYGMNQMITNFDQNMTKILGKHQIVFGGRYGHERFGYLPDRQADTIAFSNQATAVYDPATGANYGAVPTLASSTLIFFSAQPVPTAKSRTPHSATSANRKLTSTFKITTA